MSPHPSDLEWLRMMLERLRQAAINAGYFHASSEGGAAEKREIDKADAAREEILEAAKFWNWGKHD